MAYPTQRIVYNEADGMARVLMPGDPEKTGLTVQQIAEKDVPKGLPFKIIEKLICHGIQTVLKIEISEKLGLLMSVALTVQVLRSNHEHFH